MRQFKQTGFTLIELIAVVALIAIMLAIAVPSFASFMANHRVTAATNDFLQGVTITRLEALKRGRFVDMVPKSPGNWKSGWRIILDNNKDHVWNSGATPPEEVIFEHDPLSSFITVSDPTGGGFADDADDVYIAFDGSGFLRQHTATGGVLKGGIVMVDNGATTPTAQHVLCLAVAGRPRVFTADSGMQSCVGG